MSHEVSTVHLEITSKCNARCPMCLRTVLGGKVNPNLPLTELSLSDLKVIFPIEFVRGLSRLYMCGNYGDPMVASDTLEAFKYFREVNPKIHLEMFTNGSGRSPDWWKELASTVNKCRFGIDGLEDTNHIYRRGTKWPLILRAVESFIGAGGHAEWDFIVFRHNELQVEDARQLSKKLGFKAFHVKKTGRFFSNSKVAVKDRQEVHDHNGHIEYYLEQPSNPQHINSALARESEIVSRFGTLKNFFAQTPIDCRVAKEKSLYVSAQGHVFPCCWTANQLYPWYFPKEGTPIWKMLRALPHGVDSLNALNRPIKEIIEGEFFQKSLPESWDQKNEPRLFVCEKTCGRGFDAFMAQFESKEAQPSQEKWT